MMSKKANKIVCVEPQLQYNELIKHNLALNNFNNYSLMNVHVGGGYIEEKKSKKLSITEIIKESGLERVDLMKMDIEGGEFEAFSEVEWLQITDAIVMEIHSNCGDPGCILEPLQQFQFQTIFTDENQKIHKKFNGSCSYIVAWKQSH